MTNCSDPAIQKTLDRSPTPLDMLAHWPANRRIAMLYSGDGHEQFGRWSMLAEPQGWLRCTKRSTGQLDWEMSGEIPVEIASLPTDPLEAIDEIVLQTRDNEFANWLMAIHYELGRLIEPVVSTANSAGQDEPAKVPSDTRLIELAWCPDRFVFDQSNLVWEVIGSPAEELQRLIQTQPELPQSPIIRDERNPLEPTWQPHQHIEAVERVKQFIAAGDIFQANLTQQFSTNIAIPPRALATTALCQSKPRYGAYLELPGDEVVLSLSPELFLQVDPVNRQVITRPIKGTLPSSQEAIGLWQSAKDAAELHMIVDLMRNDLGRVCEFGSVQVENSRTIETHPTVHHGVAEIHGILRVETSLGELLRATFPAGSITGAPKIRAMQIIEELEPNERGIYCGSIGCVDRSGNVTLNVAIRTLVLKASKEKKRAWQLTYGAGGGIVADSDAQAEWEECWQKVAVLREALQIEPF